MSKRLRIMSLGFGLGVGALLGGCTLGGNEFFQLGVPYRAQERYDYCVPACVLMWRLYDNLPSISQSTIYNWLGGSACQPDDVPPAVNYFTSTTDAYLDLEFSPDATEQEHMLARQITSIDRSRPVIAIVGDARDHVGILNGGKYVRVGNNYQWEFVFLHDPTPGGENAYYTSYRWLINFCADSSAYCGQILSSSATAGWQSYYATYQGKILLLGVEPCLPNNCGPIEN